MNKGYMLISRERFEDLIMFSNPVRFYIFFRLLFKANYEPKKFGDITVGRGQLVFSYDNLCAELNVSLQTLRSALTQLKNNTLITLKPTRKFTLLTICDYDSWQLSEDEVNTVSDIEATRNLTTTKIITNNIEKKDISKDISKEKKLEDTLLELIGKVDSLESKLNSLSEKEEKLRKKKKEVFPPENIQNERFKKFCHWLQENCPHVCQLEHVISEKEFGKLLILFGDDTKKMSELFWSMENKADLTKKYRDAYLTAYNWFKREYY